MLLNCGAGEDSWESLDCKEIKPVHPKGNQPWIFIGRTDAEAEVPTLWPPDAKNWLTGKNPNAGKDWRQEEKGMTEDEMVGCHHRCNGHEFEQTPGDAEGQGNLASTGSQRVRHNLAIEQQQGNSQTLVSFQFHHHINHFINRQLFAWITCPGRFCQRSGLLCQFLPVFLKMRKSKSHWTLHSKG